MFKLKDYLILHEEITKEFNEYIEDNPVQDRDPDTEKAIKRKLEFNKEEMFEYILANRARLIELVGDKL